MLYHGGAVGRWRAECSVRFYAAYDVAYCPVNKVTCALNSAIICVAMLEQAGSSANRSMCVLMPCCANFLKDEIVSYD